MATKKKVAAKRKPSKVMTAAQIAKKQDAIVADKEEVKKLKASLKDLKADLRAAMKEVTPIQREITKLERAVGVRLSRIERVQAEIDGAKA